MAKSHVLGYLPAKATIAEAEAVGVPVRDYIDKRDNEASRREVIDRLAAAAGLPGELESACEIGAGAGLYTERLLELCRFKRSCVYEPDSAWAGWLVDTLKVTSLPADGVSLQATPSASIDLMTAHNVFIYLPFLTAYGYFEEMARVTRPGGIIAFDLCTEDACDEEVVAYWRKHDWNWLTFFSKSYVVNLFAKHRATLIASYVEKRLAIRAEYLVFRKA